jgi:hypothetical protein
MVNFWTRTPKNGKFLDQDSKKWQISGPGLKKWQISGPGPRKPLTYMNPSERHSHSGRPNGLILQVPGQFIHTPIKVCIPSNSIPAFQWQRLSQNHVIVGTISATAADLFGLILNQ